MRPTGKAQTESFYFKYPYFEAPKGAERDNLKDGVRVAIVGAGSISMTAALALSREGIQSVLFDSKIAFND